jgi:6-phosphogluconolactonase/glucosamine-6-phosphate isomerase/deaminase
MTLPLINASRCAIVLATGPDKTAAVRRALSEDDLPACRVQLVNGTLEWLVEQAALGN